MRRSISFLAFCCFSALVSANQATTPIAIVIHGGAGTINKSQMTEAQEQAYHATLKHAVETGYAVLEKGGSSVDAVTAAVLIMEDSPLFNAGKGSVYTYDEGHELDASIMRGDNLMAGAVSGITVVKNPVLLARAVMEKSEHVMLSGAGAEQFAKEQGLELVENSYFDTEFRYDALKKAKQSMKKVPHQAQNYRLKTPWQAEWNMGTVGAVAMDRSGLLTAATSTGGMTAKRYGRIGDAPIIGAGNFADNSSCAVSATGHGEFFIRYRVASDICARVKYQGISADKAADQVIQQELAKVGGTGGVILIDHKGKVGWSFNTEGMYRAKKTEGEATISEIFKESSAK
jgi:beta-aspartyl-peptidase (threonine type)